MNTKSRVTLDNSGLRIRPRSYVDSHVPKRVTPRIVNDVSTHVSSPAQPEPGQQLAQVVISTTDVAATAKVYLRRVEQIPRPAQDPAQPALPKSPIAELVSKIQFSESVNQADAVAKPRGKMNSISVLRSLRGSWASRSILVSAMAVLLITGGLVALVSSLRSNRLVTMQVQALSEKSEQDSDESEGQTSSSQAPSEDKVPDAVVSSYSVAADVPKYISIPKIKISKTRILRLGLDKDGAPKTPRNVWDTGWYEGSSKPSDATGAALIMGHVSGPTNGGIFYNLYRLANGDEIQVTNGDGTILTYKVVAKEEVPVTDINMNNYLVSKNIDKPGITLMTCSGEFNPVTQTYDKRLAVFAIRSN